jgi:hypothetical protein
MLKRTRRVLWWLIALDIGSAALTGAAAYYFF